MIHVVIGEWRLNGKLLIALREDTLMWELPGGKVEPDETLPEALRREWQEELRLDIVVGEHLYSSEHRDEPGMPAFWAVTYSITVPSTRDNRDLMSTVHHGTMWVPPKFLCSFKVMPSLRDAIEKGWYN